MPLASRLPQISAGLSARADEVVGRIAEDLAADVRDNTPTGPPNVHLKDHITVRHVDVGKYSVQVGDTSTFYGHIVEHGSVYAAPHPFVVPAVERIRGRLRDYRMGDL